MCYLHVQKPMYIIKLCKYENFQFIHINPIGSRVYKEKRHTIFLRLIRDYRYTLYVKAFDVSGMTKIVCDPE